MPFDLGHMICQYVVEFLFDALLLGDPLLPAGMLICKLQTLCAHCHLLIQGIYWTP
jgi:hypothetical protein